jgi:hypothetical protein
MAGYCIRNLDKSRFDSYSFTIAEAGREKKQDVEGHLYKFLCELNRGATLASALQIVRNFQDAARAAGGQTLWEAGEGTSRSTTVRFRRGTTEVWITVDFHRKLCKKELVAAAAASAALAVLPVAALLALGAYHGAQECCHPGGTRTQTGSRQAVALSRFVKAGGGARIHCCYSHIRVAAWLALG